ncbi:MAG: uroporphyrinogen-III synthase [Alphaproteobacteria bacterium]|nr:uroporphyrinogen-III synthase [Alphaproteobacteria bacterium]
MTADLSRCGRRALVTRPRGEAESLAAALAARGIDAVIEPLLQIRHRARMPLEFENVQAVLCTSVNGVRALARASCERHVPLLAVGDATAARARDEGFSMVESAGGAVGDLAALAASRLRPENGRLLHVAGTLVAGDLAADLRRRGFAVERAVLYEATPVRALSRTASQALSSGMIDFALFFSPRTAVVFVRLIEAAGIAGVLRGVAAVSISPAADAALSALAWRERRVARRPNQAELLASLDRAVATSSQPAMSATEDSR